MSVPACIILAAGAGTRLKSKYPKALQPLCGKPLIDHVLDTVEQVRMNPVIVVVGAGADQMRALLSDRDVLIAEQPEQKGTGHAVLCARPLLADYDGDVLVTCADIPLVRAETLQDLIACHRRAGAVATVLTTIPEDPTGYGRVVRDERGMVRSIGEDKDADEQIRQIKEINTSIYCFRAPELFAALPQITPNNVQGEYYLTDVIPVLLDRGLPVAATMAEDPVEVMGINTRVQQATAEAAARERVRQQLMAAGVTLLDPPSVFVDQGVEIAPDTIIWPGAFVLGHTQIGSDCCIGEYVRLENCRIADRVFVKHCSVVSNSRLGQDVQIGPFSHIRDESQIAQGTRVGSYAEVVRSHLGPHVRDLHFSYLGDAQVGADVNIGAGTITCNYDGQIKHQTIIEDGAFIGSDVAIVAPVTIGKGAYVGAGSVITQDVPPGSLAVGRIRQENIEGWADRST